MTFAFFDIDRTILGGRAHLSALYYFWRRGWLKSRSWPKLILAGLRYQFQKALGRPDADQLMAVVYSFTAGHKFDEFRKEMEIIFKSRMREKILIEARHEIEEHQAAGRSIVLISTALGSLADLIGQELKADQVVSSRLEVKSGYLTGNFERIVFSQEKLRQARLISSDLKKDYFYSDCYSDLFLLRAVGFPRVVNPDWRLRRVAKQKKWPVYYWHN